MGQDQSTATPTTTTGAGEDPFPSSTSPVDIKKVEGFQVMRVIPNGAAAQAGLCPYFDLITHVNEFNLSVATVEETPMAFFRRLLAEHYNYLLSNSGGEGSKASKPLYLTVFNLRCRYHRHIRVFLKVAPSSPSETGTTGGGVTPTPKGGLLGCSVEWKNALEAVTKGSLHILEILPDSPFALVGASTAPGAPALIQAERDYIIGMQSSPKDLFISMLKGEKDLHERIEAFLAYQHMHRVAAEQRQEKEKLGLIEKQPPQTTPRVPQLLLFLIYNSESNTVEEVAIRVDPSGGPLGIRIGSGVLHFIPTSTDPTALPRLTRYFLPSDYNFEVDYTEEQQGIAQRQQQQQQQAPPPQQQQQQAPPPIPQEPPQDPPSPCQQVQKEHKGNAPPQSQLYTPPPTDLQPRLSLFPTSMPALTNMEEQLSSKGSVSSPMNTFTSVHTATNNRIEDSMDLPPPPHPPHISTAPPTPADSLKSLPARPPGIADPSPASGPVPPGPSVTKTVKKYSWFNPLHKNVSPETSPSHADPAAPSPSHGFVPPQLPMDHSQHPNNRSLRSDTNLMQPTEEEGSAGVSSPHQPNNNNNNNTTIENPFAHLYMTRKEEANTGAAPSPQTSEEDGNAVVFNTTFNEAAAPAPMHPPLQGGHHNLFGSAPHSTKSPPPPPLRPHELQGGSNYYPPTATTTTTTNTTASPSPPVGGSSAAVPPATSMPKANPHEIPPPLYFPLYEEIKNMKKP